MSSSYIFFDRLSGEITKVMECQDKDLSLNRDENEDFVRDKDGMEATGGTHFVSVLTGEVIRKTPLSVSCEISGLLVSVHGAPLGSTICVVGFGEAVVSDNSLEIEFDSPGTYVLRVLPNSLEFLDQTLEVTVD